MQRRRFHQSIAALAVSPLMACADATAQTAPASVQSLATLCASLEADVGGRLGVAVLDTATGTLQGHRLDERFPLCSTFKWLAAALVLRRVDQGLEQIDRRIRFGPEALVPHAPVTAAHAGRPEGLSVAELCAAAVLESDNPAANLLVTSFGGPQALTAYARSVGDASTRLDRMEPEMNESRPGDPRDTTTPRGMAAALNRIVLGDALSATGRTQLIVWLEAVRTNTHRLRAGLPAGWRLGSKTGTGERGSTNDAGVYWPPGRPPLVVAAYLTDCQAPMARRNAVIASIGRHVRSLA